MNVNERSINIKLWLKLSPWKTNPMRLENWCFENENMKFNQMLVYYNLVQSAPHVSGFYIQI